MARRRHATPIQQVRRRGNIRGETEIGGETLGVYSNHLNLLTGEDELTRHLKIPSRWVRRVNSSFENSFVLRKTS